MKKLKRKEVYPWDNAITELLYSMKGTKDYLEGAKDFKEKLSQLRLLPSGHQIGDVVRVTFLKDNDVKTSIKKVMFSYSGVFYDLTLEYSCSTPEDPDAIYIMRLYNVDSCFVTKPV